MRVFFEEKSEKSRFVFLVELNKFVFLVELNKNVTMLGLNTGNIQYLYKIPWFSPWYAENNCHSKLKVKNPPKFDVILHCVQDDIS